MFFLLAACAGLLGFNLLSYERLTHEKHALEAHFTRVGDQQFDAVLTYPSGATQRYVLGGDEWQIDARLLKWRGAANILGFDTAYRLERIAGRYSDIDRERASPRTVYALHAPEGVDAWALLRSYHKYAPWADALYGSATYVPMADGAAYEVNVSQKRTHREAAQSPGPPSRGCVALSQATLKSGGQAAERLGRVGGAGGARPHFVDEARHRSLQRQ